MSPHARVVNSSTLARKRAPGSYFRNGPKLLPGQIVGVAKQQVSKRFLGFPHVLRGRDVRKSMCRTCVRPVRRRRVWAWMSLRVLVGLA
jgi:hypothetical protein